ncbi:MAG: hypothetical protein ABH814_01340 [bacterium]
MKKNKGMLALALALALVLLLLSVVVNFTMAEQPVGPDWGALCRSYHDMVAMEEGVNGTLSDDVGRLIADAEARGWFNCDDYR